jgi:hypothetical protein
LTSGKIPIKRENFDHIPAKNLKFLKTNVEKQAALSRLLKSDRTVKLKVLKKQVSIYSFLLYCLFNET